MKIKEILEQNRRDFKATLICVNLICEHCNSEQKFSGWDDDNFHQNVIPRVLCISCEKDSPITYRPLATKHKSHEVV